MTVRELIRGSLRLIGAIGTGDTPSAEEQADALSVLNEMLESWSTENLIIHAKVREAFTLTAGQASRTLGPSGNFNTTRPIDIEVAKIEDQSASPVFETPVDIINTKEWADISDKAVQSSLPTKLYVEWTNPLLTLYFWPVPSAANKLVLYSLKPLTSFSSPNDLVTLPPGYQKALRYNLALELAGEYGRPISDFVLLQADDSKGNIKRKNIKPLYMDCDAGVLSTGSRFDYRTGE
jgi:hypothetical protein